MRLFLLLAVACALQGCATIGGLGVTAEVERQRRADATLTGADLAEHPPAPGDTLMLVLVRGDTLRGIVTTATPDSVALDVGTVALADVARAERPWKRANYDRTLFLGLLLEVFAFAYLVSHTGWGR